MNKNTQKAEEKKNVFATVNEEKLDTVAGGKIKDREGKEWWEYALDVVHGVSKGLGHCFTGESTVSTPEGTKPIKDIKPGDEVLSLDKDGNIRTGKVVKVIEPAEMPVVEVTFTDGRKWNTTATQWFYCGGDDYACVLDAGDKKALTLDGKKIGVKTAVETGRKEMVYDFIVDDLNVMFINGVCAEGFSVD